MPNYRRAWSPGGTWFFTVTLADRRSRLLVDRVDVLRQAFQVVRVHHPFHIDAVVILPDHLHAIWTLPAQDTDFATRWRLIKTRFSRAMPLVEPRRPVQDARGERGIWQRRYWEHLIRDDADYERHVAYCYFNPVKHGLVDAVRDWPYSSFHRDVARGLVAPEWTGVADADGDYGEVS